MPIDLTIGFTSVMVSEEMEEVSISIAVYSGVLRPGHDAHVVLQAQSPQSKIILCR